MDGFEQVVYVVVEDDRGCGPSVLGTYLNREDAESVANESCHAFVEESILK